MGAKIVWGTRILIALVLRSLTSAVAVSSSVPSVRVPLCRMESAADYILGFRDRYCPLCGSASDESASYPLYVAVTEGDEPWLQMALDMIRKRQCNHVALLFYASWCPFSRSFRPTFDLMSSLYSSVAHFAIEESTVRSSTLSKYDIRGFPTLILLNSTMRVRYHGLKTLGHLVAFYSDFTGIKMLDKTLLVENELVTTHLGKHNSTEQESCPFSWARYPENLIQQETYLALATAFVVLRLLYLFLPTLLVFAEFSWRRLTQNIRPGSLVERPVAFLSQLVEFPKSLKESCKRSELQEGAMNARAWASKSLATVSLGDASSSRGGATCQ